MSGENYSIGSLVGFIEMILPSLGVVTDSTLKNMKTVPRLLAFADTSVNDIRDINTDELIQAYVAENGDVSDSSLRSYKSRIQQAISIYKDFLDKPKNQNGEATLNSEPKKVVRRKPSAVKVESPKTFELPIPLRGDLIVTITNLPRDLSREEARRISTIVESFAIPDGNDLA